MDVAAAGILLADETGRLRVIGASTEQVQLLELFQLQSDEGPCLDCYRTGLVVASERLDAESPWPVFAAESLRVGFPSVCAVPLRLHDVVLGCLNLFMRDPVPLGALDVALARALADVASIAIVQDQATREAAVREGQLQHALSSRIVIEQAKGMLAEFAGVDMDHAFARLRSFARNRNRRLTEVAAELVAGSIAVAQVSPGRVPPPRPARRARRPPDLHARVLSQLRSAASEWWPSARACCSAVTPCRSASSGSAPAASRMPTISW